MMCSTDYHGIDTAMMISGCTEAVASENFCYMIPTESAETSCLATDTSSTNDDCTSTSSDGLAITGIIFGCLGALSAMYCAFTVHQLAAGTKAPLSSKTDSAATENNNL